MMSASIQARCLRQSGGRAEESASAAQEGLERRRDDSKSALFQPPPHPLRAARQHDRAVERHGVGGKARRLFMIYRQAMLWSDTLLDGAQPAFGESARVIDHIA